MMISTKMSKKVVKWSFVVFAFILLTAAPTCSGLTGILPIVGYLAIMTIVLSNAFVSDRDKDSEDEDFT